MAKVRKVKAVVPVGTPDVAAGCKKATMANWKTKKAKKN